MLKVLHPMEGGMAVVLDAPLLAIIGAADATELDLTTDGQRLILSPVKSPRREAPVVPPSPAARLSSNTAGFHPDNPKDTVRVILALQASHGFTQEHFRQLHHAGPKASLQAHINYCRGTGRFVTETNPIVGKRLHSCLKSREQGIGWDEAIAQARRDFPFPANVQVE